MISATSVAIGQESIILSQETEIKIKGVDFKLIEKPGENFEGLKGLGEPLEVDKRELNGKFIEGTFKYEGLTLGYVHYSPKNGLELLSMEVTDMKDVSLDGIDVNGKNVKPLFAFDTSGRSSGGKLKGRLIKSESRADKFDDCDCYYEAVLDSAGRIKKLIFYMPI